MSETIQHAASEHENFSPTDLAAIQEALPRLMREDIAIDGTQNGLWFARQLDYVKAKVYERLFPAINANRLVPDATDTPEWAETITIRMFTNVGLAKVIANYADDLPRADVAGASKTVTVKTLGDSFGYNVNELRASRATGMGLDQRKADAARRAMELKIALIKLQGDATFGLYGLFNHPNISEFIFPNPGAWTTLTGDQIYANLVGMYFAYQNASLGVHQPNFLELAPLAYQAASSKFITAPVVSTALGMFQAQFPSVTVENIFECAGADTTGKDVALLYERSPDNLAHEYVMPFTQLPPEARNLEIVTDCIARSGGVQIYYPLSLLKGMTS
jgi:hypothetical protein